jgi:NADH-quinone oxidoreductase subunit H
MSFFFLQFLHQILLIIIFILISVAYLTLAERKIMASIQRRRGPNVIGYLGLLQPLADGLKLFVKETILPTGISTGIFFLAPLITFCLSLLGWAVIPFHENSLYANLNLGILYILSISGIGVYGIVLSGWASNSKYAFLGCLRSASQMISYEASIGFILISVILCSGSFNLFKIVIAQKNIWYFLQLFPIFILFFISALAETNRHPFDLPEAEAELVSGYNVEYSGMSFALFFLGEYANILLMSALTSILFFGGWFFPLFNFSFNCLNFKICIFVILFCWIRAALPRYRYDQLMTLGWKTFLPFSIVWLIFTSSVLISFNWLPY